MDLDAHVTESRFDHQCPKVDLIDVNRAVAHRHRGDLDVARRRGEDQRPLTTEAGQELELESLSGDKPADPDDGSVG
ncbi:MAG TPA: hypothetical protein VFD39_01155 [Trueperaceae bacterium]|nr:hypothetical protein [Trueperaceae bacterium]